MSEDLHLEVPDSLLDLLADRVAERLAVPEPAKPETNGKLALTLTEAAESIGVSADHFKRHVAPEIRIVRSGRLRLVPVSELEAWLERHAARALAGARLAHEPKKPHGKRD